MILELVSPLRAITVWTLASLISITTKLFWPASGVDLSYLKVPYFIITYTLAALVQGVVLGLAIRGYLGIVRLLFTRLQWSRTKALLLAVVIGFVLGLSALALTVIPEGRIPGSPWRAVVSLCIAIVAIFFTARAAIPSSKTK
jgi:NO-binding membrane sensor protein with MHYT domain